ncbi:hypothetical protein M011DRAFT_469588 [Sporormia fimetaria CBS 119925]|uniref:Uncharacterized protein n=1 Tax=Sporormia fimetaria CBS 119925 TaxID=1340428 RepID=A0A6A6V735_9PLEO|nr:hypothetical protein M011DRAFT_469588 [Sporormia fimetaria CBS 119925]
MQNSVFDIFTTLAILPYSSPNSQRHPGMDRPDLVLNFLEAWCCLLFRCLPPTLLRQYLPEHVDAVKEGKEANQALNVANPLDNGETENPREFVDLYESEDPLVLEYLHELERKRRPEPPTVVIQQPAIPPEVLEPPGLAQRLGLTPATLVLIGAVAVMGIVLVKRGPASVGRPR